MFNVEQYGCEEGNASKLLLECEALDFLFSARLNRARLVRSDVKLAYKARAGTANSLLSYDEAGVQNINVMIAPVFVEKSHIVLL